MAAVQKWQPDSKYWECRKYEGLIPFPQCCSSGRQQCCAIFLPLHLHLHLAITHGDHWGFLHFSLFSTSPWDLANSRIVHSLMLSSHLFFCFPISFSVCFIFFPFSLCLARWFWPDLMNKRHVHTTAICISLRSSGLRVVQLPAGSWHGLPG